VALDMISSIDDVLNVRMREAAVIDIGSNSVRLVVYRLEGRSIAPVLNEKVLAGLGRGLSATGRLDPAGVLSAIASLKRFRLMLNALEITEIYPFATAAVRDATDGPAFLKHVSQEAGFNVRVLTGNEEAQFAALGVQAGAPYAAGIVGDLGGSSLELVELDGNLADGGETHRLGPLAAGIIDPFDRGQALDFIETALADSRVLSRAQGSVFHAVGGAWRSLARIDMALRSYPLHVLHNYSIPRAEAEALADFVSRQSKRSLEKLQGTAGRRAETLPYAALLLGVLMARGGFERVSLSSYGVREGLLFNTMESHVRSHDPLLSGAAAMAGGDRRTKAFGAALSRWVAPAFDALTPLFDRKREAVLRDACCQFADIGAALHPDHRAPTAFDLVLHGPFAGAEHFERAFMAVAIHRRYAARGNPPELNVVQRLLSVEARARAEALGAAMRLGADLSARSAILLRDVSLKVVDGSLILHAHSGLGALITDQVRKRLDQLGDALKMPVRVTIE